MKEQEKIPEKKKTSETEITDKEFKVLLIKMLIELGNRINNTVRILTSN